MPGKTRVLFLSTHNAARSQMAEAYLRAVAGDRYEVASAGTDPARVHPLAIRVMQEIGLDISSHMAKPVKPFLGEVWHYVITVCDDNTEHCPIFPFPAKPLRWEVLDLLQATGTEGERLQVFRQVRDEIFRQLQAWLAEQNNLQNTVGRQDSM